MGRILDVLRRDHRKGRLLEEVLAEALKDLGFSRVAIQGGGTQYGRDVTASRMSPADGFEEVWAFECKNLSEPMTVEHLAPKLVWQWGRSTIDCFVIVGTSGLGNDLRQWLEQHELSMPVAVWTGDVLEEMISRSPRALKRLGLGRLKARKKKHLAEEVTAAGYVFVPRAPVVLDAVHKDDPPAWMEYVAIEHGIIKTYVGNGFRLHVIATRRRRVEAKILSLDVETVSYSRPAGRVLRLTKPKGLFEPPLVTFTPSTLAGTAVELLGDRVWVLEDNRDVVDVTLAESVPSGIYDLQLRARCHTADALFTLRTPRFVVRVRAPEEDSLDLFVRGRHYDGAAAAVLRADDRTWEMLKAERSNDGQLVCVGPGDYEFTRSLVDKTWIVRAYDVRREPDGSVSWDFAAPGRVVWDSRVPVREELYSLDVAFARVRGEHPWQHVLPTQLRRRATL